MKTTKRLLAVVLCIAMIAATGIPALASVPNIDSASSWARDGITEAVGDGYIPADIQGNYTSVITRAEFCRLAVSWLEFTLGKNIATIVAENGDPAKTGHTFSDTTDPAILAAYRLGVTNGTRVPTATEPGLFNPNGEFSREQAATMVRNTMRAAGIDVSNVTSAGFTDIGDAASWAVDGINYVRNAGIMGGTSTTPLRFSPKTNYTREQSILTFNNVDYDALPKAQPGTTTPPQQERGELLEIRVNSHGDEAGNEKGVSGFLIFMKGDTTNLPLPVVSNITVFFEGQPHAISNPTYLSQSVSYQDHADRTAYYYTFAINLWFHQLGEYSIEATVNGVKMQSEISRIGN
jgi:hypothetical protein